MTEYTNTIVFNGVSLKVRSLSPIRTQKTVKQFMGKALTETKVLGVSDQQWRLEINGFIYGTTTANLSTNRAAIEGLDTNTPYVYTDGIHNGTYSCVPGSLRISDSGETGGGHYTYTMSLLEQ